MSTTSVTPVVLSTDAVSKSPDQVQAAEPVSISPAVAVTPTIKTITAFLQFNGDMTELNTAVTVLQESKAKFNAAGYAVETLRVTTQPFIEYNHTLGPDLLGFLQSLNDLAGEQDFRINIGAAMLNDTDDPSGLEFLKQVLPTMTNLESSAIIADTNGIHWTTIGLAAELIQYLSWYSPEGQANLNFAVSAMQGEYSPFFPGTWLNDEGQQYSSALECSAGVQAILQKDKGNYAAALTDLQAGLTTLLGTAGSVQSVFTVNGVPWGGGCGLTTAPGGGGSIAAAVEAYTGVPFGGPGTLTALQLINQQIPGIMLPVLQDELLAQRWAEGSLTWNSLLAYAAIGANGLDAVPLPGGVTVAQLQAILSDVALLATKCNTAVSARLVPAPWRNPGDRTTFNTPGIYNTIIQPLA